ncbi:unnamed protein product [Hydatigera taeniaeformis]|uniref:DUF4005 domain-containing protein n=1 Tax=Hydatigena taeniaeformis TaxID=6205 RepID=A0A0R3WLW9_HYDTA|nr:unnamed protein product [Hydatigera taeniaeformis]
MWPTRSLSQRQDDIITLSGFERMNVVLPRNRTPVDDATAALEKWRLLSRHYVDVEGLVTGLTLAGWSAWAKEVLIRFGQDVGLATKSEKVTFDVKEAGDASAEERMNLEIEMKENLSADKELLRQSTNENDTSVKSPHDEISETVHQNWSQESIRSELICESSVDDFDKQSSLNAIGNQCHGEPGFSPIQEGSVLEASSTEQNVLSEEGDSKNSSLPSSRPGSIVKEAETEQHNSSNDVSDNSSHNSLKQDELVDKSDHFSEEDEIIDSSPTHFSCKTSLSNDTSTKRNDCSRQISRYIGQKDSKSTRHIRSAKPCNRGESSKTTTKASISDYKLQNSHDKSSTCAIHGAWKSHENFKVKSVGSEGDEETNSQKQKLESDRGEMEECPTQKPMTSKRAASVNTSESMKDEHHSDRTLSFEMDNYCFCTEAKKNKIKQDALVVRRDTVEPKSESSKNENLKGSSKGEEDEHGSDKIMKFDADASLAKVKDEDSTCQCEIPTSQGEDAMSNDDCSIRPSPLQYDDNEKGIGESRSKEDEPVEKLVENIIKSSPKSKLLMTGRRTSKIQKNNHLSKGNKKSHKVFHEKTKGDNEANKVELTKAAKRGGCGSTKSASFREEESPKDSNIPNEIENQIIRISIESENSGKTPSISSSKKKSRDENSRGKKNRGANEKK